METVRYEGFRDRGAARVVVHRLDEKGKIKVEELDKRLDLRNHSPTGFEWGYGGSGPSQLALAILADLTDDETAMRHYQFFKQGVISRLDQDRTWILAASVIRARIDKQEEWMRSQAR